jgi:hypothetical protein
VEKLSDIVDLSDNEIQLQLQYYSHWYIVKRYVCCTTASIWQLHHSHKYSQEDCWQLEKKREDQVAFFVSTFDSAFSCSTMMIGLTKAAAMAVIA